MFLEEGSSIHRLSYLSTCNIWCDTRDPALSYLDR